MWSIFFFFKLAIFHEHAENVTLSYFTGFTCFTRAVMSIVSGWLLTRIYHLGMFLTFPDDFWLEFIILVCFWHFLTQSVIIKITSYLKKMLNWWIIGCSSVDNCFLRLLKLMSWIVTFFLVVEFNNFRKKLHKIFHLSIFFNCIDVILPEIILVDLNNMLVLLMKMLVYYQSWFYQTFISTKKVSIVLVNIWLLLFLV